MVNLSTRLHTGTVGIVLGIADPSTKDDCINCLNSLVNRTTILHTRFNKHNGIMEQEVHKPLVQLACTDLFFHSNTSWIGWRQNLPIFSITDYPLIKLYWVTVSPASLCYLVIVMPRLLIDEAGAATLVRQFWSLLKDGSIGDTVPFEELVATRIEYWKDDQVQSLSTIFKNVFSGYATSADTPFALLPVIAVPRYKIEQVVVPDQTVQAVKNCISKYGGSPEALFLSAWFLMIRQFAQAKDICVEMYHALPSAERAIGNHSNVIPLRRAMVEAETFKRFYYGIHTFYKPLVHHGFPAHLIVEALQTYGLQPADINRYGFAFHDLTGFHHPGHDLVDVTGKYCLNDKLLNISWMDKQVVMQVEYNAAVYEQGMVKSLLACMLYFLENIDSDFDTPMRTIRITPPGQLDIIRNPLANKLPPFNNKTYTRPVVQSPPGCCALIVDNRKQLLPAGAIGEILWFKGDLPAAHNNLSSKQLADVAVSSGMTGYWQENGDIIQVGKNKEWVTLPGKRIFLCDLQVWINNRLKDGAVIILANPNSSGNTKNSGQSITIFYKGPVGFTSDNMPWPALPIDKTVVYVSDFPQRGSGEIDSEKLWESVLPQQSSFVSPSHPVVQGVLRVWQEVLGTSREIDLNENFFAAGGNSLKALVVISGIFEAFNVALELKSVYDSWTIQKMAAAILQTSAHHQSSQTTVIEKIPDAPDNLYASSPGQARLWSVCQHETAIKAYNIRQVIKLSAAFDTAVFKQVIVHLVNEYEILRTVFIYDRNEVKQKIVAAWNINAVLTEVQVNDIDRTDLIRSMYDKSLFAFSMAEGPLFHIDLAEFSNGQQYLFLSIHHIIADYWSLTILFNRITTLYKELRASKSTLSAGPSLQYKDFSQWQRQLLVKQREGYADYWKSQLANLSLNTRLPYDFPRPEQRSFKAKMVHRTLPLSVKERLHQVSVENNASLQMTVFTILNLALYRYTVQNKNAIIVHFAGRDHEQLKNQIGLFVNTLPLIVPIDPLGGFDVNLQATKKIFLEAYESQYYPFDWLLQDVNVKWSPRSAPVSSVGFNWLYFNNEQAQEDIGEMIRMDDRGISQFDMLITGIERGHELELAIEYSTDLYTPETMSLFLDEMLDIMEGLHTATIPVQQLLEKNILTSDNNFIF